MDAFSVLGVRRDDDFNVIKEAYHKLILTSHPDKNTSVNSVNEFLIIQDAWKHICLELENNKEKSSMFSESVSFANLNSTDEFNFLSYPCRCGGIYEVN